MICRNGDIMEDTGLERQIERQINGYKDQPSHALASGDCGGGAASDH